jgi:hypothetical protein
MLRRSLGPRFRGDERRKFASTASWLLRRDRGFVETLANVVYKVTGLPPLGTPEITSGLSPPELSTMI